MRIVLDTNIIVKAIKDSSWDHLAVLNLLRLFEQNLLLDYEGILFGEYRANAGNHDLFQKWFQEMQNRGLLLWESGHLSNRVAGELRRHHLHEPGDHVVIALAINGDHYIITEDSDFGKGDSARAAHHQDAWNYLCNELMLTIHDAREACEKLKNIERG